MTARRAGLAASISASAAVLAAALLVTLLVTWAASIGPGGVLRGDGRTAHRAEPSSSARIRVEGSPDFTDPRIVELPPPRRAEHVVGWVALAVEVATVGLALYLLWRLARRLRKAYDERRRGGPHPEEVDFEVLGAPAVADEILRGAADQRALLAEGVPRDAIVAAWHHFEVQATAGGVSRRPWETSSEFTLRVLDLVEAVPHEVARLAALYREARFSEHAMSEADRAAALEALDVIHRGLHDRRGDQLAGGRA